MFVKHSFYIGLSDVNILMELTNTSLLKYLENVASMHSEMVGYGLTDINKTRKTWVLLAWKVEVKKRPLINDTLIIKTWSRKIDKFYAYRDFEVRNQYDEIVAIASSKWVFIDIDKEKIVRVTQEIIDCYKQEPISVFKEDFNSVQEPEIQISTSNFKVTRSLIDINKHLHNVYYLDVVKEGLPEEISFSNELNYFEIMYKKEIKLGETVKAIYSKQEDYHYITIKSKDESIIHSIIKLK